VLIGSRIRRLLPRRPGVAVALSAMVVLGTTSCVSPAINSEGYRGKVEQSAKTLVGIIGSAQLAAQLELDGKMLSTITDELISEAEQDSQSVSTSLDSVQPPNQESISLRDRADSILQDASSQLSDLRIAERGSDHHAMRETLDDLAKTLTHAQQLQADT
jgi:hypothetical protein